MAFQQAALLEEADRAIDRRQADAGVDLGRAPVESLDVGMIRRIREDARDHAPLFGHLQADFAAALFQRGYRQVVPLLLKRLSPNIIGQGAAQGDRRCPESVRAVAIVTGIT